MGINDEGGADGREQTSLQEQPTRADDRWQATQENQGGVEVLVVLLDVVHIVLGRLPLVHGVEVDAGIIGLDGLEERPQGVLESTPSQRSATRMMYSDGVVLEPDLQQWATEPKIGQISARIFFHNLYLCLKIIPML